MMRRLATFSRDCSASVAVEMALLVPVLLVLLFGGLEAGHYLWREHEVLKGVRDGARFASRMPFDAFDCSGGGMVNATDHDKIGSVTRTGTTDATSTTPVRVPGWTANTSPLIDIVVTCNPAHNTGLYAEIDTGAPVVRVMAEVNYRPLFGTLGFATTGLRLRGSSQATVMGI